MVALTVVATMAASTISRPTSRTRVSLGSKVPLRRSSHAAVNASSELPDAIAPQPEQFAPTANRRDRNTRWLGRKFPNNQQPYAPGSAIIRVIAV
jgi:hypothetical protein